MYIFRDSFIHVSHARRIGHQKVVTRLRGGDCLLLSLLPFGYGKKGTKIHSSTKLFAAVSGALMRIEIFVGLDRQDQREIESG